jgi:hypothetical protein
MDITVSLETIKQNQEHMDNQARRIAELEKQQATLLSAAKLTYELTAKWQSVGLFNTLKTQAPPADVRELEDLEAKLENAIFAVEPDYGKEG